MGRRTGHARGCACIPSLRARIQDLVDRRYRRPRYEGVRRVRAFEDEVRDGVRAPEEPRRFSPTPCRIRSRRSSSGSPRRARTPTRPATGWTSSRRTSELVVKSNARYADGRVAPRSDAARATRSPERRSRLPHRRSRWRGSPSRCASSSRRRRPRARIVEAGYEERRALGARPPRRCSAATRLARRSSGASSSRCRTMHRYSRRRSIRSSPRWEILPTSVRSPPGFDRLGSTRLAAALRDLARTSPVPVDVEASSERAPAASGSRVLRRL